MFNKALCHNQVEGDLGLAVFNVPADTDARAAALMDLHRKGSVASAAVGLDAKERGPTDEAPALVAAAMVAAWRQETPPRSTSRLLQVKAETCSCNAIQEAGTHAAFH